MTPEVLVKRIAFHMVGKQPDELTAEEMQIFQLLEDACILDTDDYRKGMIVYIG